MLTGAAAWLLVIRIGPCRKLATAIWSKLLLLLLLLLLLSNIQQDQTLLSE